MTDRPLAGAREAALRFLQQVVQDREQGQLRTLEEYQRMFPGDPQTIAEEYEAIMRPQEEEADGNASGRYAAPELLGKGGMGVVERVYDGVLERSVARKRIGDGAVRVTDLDRIRRFQHEARIMARLQHPGIVPVFDLGHDDEGRAYFTMPVLDGENLADAVARGDEAGWTRVRLVEVLARVADAVAHAHERGVVHRDLKPANVMVGPNGETFVVDWGVARALGGEDPSLGDEPELSGALTRDGDVVGTPAYMSPEQARGERDRVDQRSDVYSLGAMLYHVLAGVPPYLSRGDAASGKQTRERVLAGPPQPVALSCPDAPAELVSICDRAMGRERERRYADAAEMAADLRAFLEHRVVRAYRTGPLAELRTWIRRNRAVAAATAAAVLALVVGVVVSVQQKVAADTNAEVADENFELAFDAAEGLLVEFGQYALASDPAMDNMRRAMATRALRYYRRFVELRGEDPRLADKVAMSHLRIALLESRLGHAKEAMESLERARVVYEALRAKGGDHRLELAQIGIEQNLLRMERGETEAAIEGLQRATAVAGELLSERPRQKDLAVSRAAGLHNLAMALGDARRFDEALAVIEQKLEGTEALLAYASHLPRVHEIHASGLMLRGTTLQSLDRLDEALPALAGSVDVLEEAMERFPENRGLRARFAEVLNLHAVAALRGGNRDAAGTSLMRSIKVGRRLVAANPDVRDFQGNLAGALCNLSVLAKGRKDFENALGMLHEALPHIRRALEIDPGYRAFRNYRRIIGRELAVVSIQLGRHRDAAVHVHELVTELPGQNDWTAAVLLGMCASRCAADKSLNEAQRKQLLDAYGDGAMLYLKAAAERGTFRKDRIGEAVFDRLRSRADFQALVEEQGR